MPPASAHSKRSATPSRTSPGHRSAPPETRRWFLRNRHIHRLGIPDCTVCRFPEQVIEAHRKMVEHRRGLRDSHEYRTVTPEESAEFEQHFQLRRVALGDCFRPYGTPCVHEHVPLTETVGRPWHLGMSTQRDSLGGCHLGLVSLCHCVSWPGSAVISGHRPR
jgi:hypothetical protein